MEATALMADYVMLDDLEIVRILEPALRAASRTHEALERGHLMPYDAEQYVCAPPLKFTKPTLDPARRLLKSTTYP